LCCTLELTLCQTPSQEQYREIVARALAQAENVSWLAKGIRELFDAAEAREDSEILQLQVVVHDAISDLLPVAELAGVRICYLPRSGCPVRFEAERLRRGLFHLLGFVVGWGGSGDVVKIELGESGNDAVLALNASGQGAAHAQVSAPNSSEDYPPRELARRLGLGIARAIFEAAGGSFSVEGGVDGVSVQVQLPRAR